MTLPAYAEAVLTVVEAVPAGRVVTYGDVAAALGTGGPRQVGRVMALWGGAVPWHRVIRADGRPAAGHEVEALARLAAEGCPLTADGSRVELRAARWTPPVGAEWFDRGSDDGEGGA